MLDLHLQLGIITDDEVFLLCRLPAPLHVRIRMRVDVEAVGISVPR
jgi:hypothetical protein